MQPIDLVLRGAAGLALTALVAVPVITAVTDPAEHDTPHGSVTAALARSITTPAADVPQQCHGTGALILQHGRVRQVSLARGLRTYEHRAAGTFIRLCPVAPQGS